MTQRILVTGGAGFIGSHVAGELLEAGYRVRVLDTLSPQVHGPGAVRPTYLNPDIELLIGDVRHCFADISLARRRLGYEPRITLDRGIEHLNEWLSNQVATDRIAEHQVDLRTRGLTI